MLTHGVGTLADEVESLAPVEDELSLMAAVEDVESLRVGGGEGDEEREGVSAKRKCLR
jgi:hypothetical protein